MKIRTEPSPGVVYSCVRQARDLDVASNGKKFDLNAICLLENAGRLPSPTCEWFAQRSDASGGAERQLPPDAAAADRTLVSVSDDVAKHNRVLHDEGHPQVCHSSLFHLWLQLILVQLPGSCAHAGPVRGPVQATRAHSLNDNQQTERLVYRWYVTELEAGFALRMSLNGQFQTGQLHAVPKSTVKIAVVHGRSKLPPCRPPAQ